MRRVMLLCLLLFACTPQATPKDTQPDLVGSTEATLPESAPVWETTPTPVETPTPKPIEPKPIVGETVEEFVEDKAECWKDSDCGQDCASNYIMNVYKCDLSRHACVPGYRQPYSTVQCEEKYGYGFRCRVGRCVRGS